ncbi:MAG: ribosome-associated translation inhibitor RaiA [Euryhalocaulis sp.]|uniref:ribosome hibernation-promoting factor, HPF/YfiA family n=1 Tax=Euryhalocaulis sp. TaxID=2744307 RepID=UPI0017C5F2CC|nr:ribosome-associated translation inhibitor RaiA [Euryhalocaulis sp.]MBA4802385.1 ribosome-associated translation inhibitor RaiA [Euryhalocaulis sp.]
MQTQFVAKGVDLSDALRERVSDRINESVEKYFNRPAEALVTITKNGGQFRVKASLHLPSGVMFQTSGEGGDAYAACDDSMGRMDKRLRRYKRRLKDHGPGMKAEPPVEDVPLMVLEGRNAADAASDQNETSEPVIVAESTRELRVMPVGMAVLEMELSDAPFLLFRNAAHDAVNIVYRRPDGNIGWLDPQRAAAKSS